jgi:hypothetical protein
LNIFELVVLFSVQQTWDDYPKGCSITILAGFSREALENSLMVRAKLYHLDPSELLKITRFLGVILPRLPRLLGIMISPIVVKPFSTSTNIS